MCFATMARQTRFAVLERHLLPATPPAAGRQPAAAAAAAAAAEPRTLEDVSREAQGFPASWNKNIGAQSIRPHVHPCTFSLNLLSKRLQKRQLVAPPHTVFKTVSLPVKAASKSKISTQNAVKFDPY